MRHWSLELRVGLVIALAFVSFIFLLLNAADWQWGGGDRQFGVKFAFVNDIQEGAFVYLSGVPIGKVQRLQLVPDGALLTISISDDEQPLRVGTTASISMLGLVGENVLLLQNGPPDAERLSDGAVIQGKDPANVMETINELGRVVQLSVQTIEQVQETLQRQDAQISRVVSEIHALTQQTQTTLESTSKSTLRLIDTLDKVIGQRDKQLSELLIDLKQWLKITQEDSGRLMAQLEDTSEQISKLVDANENKVQQTLDDFANAAESFRELASQVGENSEQVELKINELLETTEDWVDEARPELQQVILGLQRNSEQAEPLIASLQRLATHLEEGDGTLSKLLKDDHTLGLVESTLQETQAALAQVRFLTQTVSEKTSPELGLGWDYELQYRTMARRLYNEANISLKRHNALGYLLGITSSDDGIGINAQAEYRYRHLRLRSGLIDTQAMLGLDYALFSERLRFRLEGTGITASEPRFAAELGIQPLQHWEVLVGVESVLNSAWPDTDWKPRLGLRLNY